MVGKMKNKIKYKKFALFSLFLPCFLFSSCPLSISSGNIEIKETIKQNAYNNKSGVYFDCENDITLVCGYKDFEIYAHFDQELAGDLSYNWTIEDHFIATFTSSMNESFVSIKPLKEGKTKLVLNVLNYANNTILSNYVNINVIDEIKTIDVTTEKNYVKPHSDIVFDFLINGEKNVVNYEFVFSLTKDNAAFNEYENISNSKICIYDSVKGTYTLKLNGLNGNIETCKVSVSSFLFMPVFMNILPYIISLLLICAIAFLGIKAKKKKTLSIEESSKFLCNIKNSFLSTPFENLSSNKQDKIMNKYIKKTMLLLKEFIHTLEHFVMFESSDAYDLLTFSIDTSKALLTFYKNGYKKMSTNDKFEALKIFYEDQLSEVLILCESFLKNYNDYQSYRNKVQKEINNNDKIPGFKVIQEFKNIDDFKEYLKKINKISKIHNKTRDK